MALSRTEARILRGLSRQVSRAEAQLIFRRGLRIASRLDGGRPDAEVVEFICDALAQEGGLVQELVEELVSRIPTSAAPPGTAPGKAQSKRKK